MSRNRRVEERARAAIGVVSLVALVVVTGGAKKEKDEPGVRELGTAKPKELTEISGMAASRLNPGVLWVANDGDSGWLYAIRTSGKLAGALKLPVRVLDVEEIALGVGPEAGVDYLYIGDIGDNDERRPEISLVRVPEPVLEGAGTVSLRTEDCEQFRLVYPDGSHNAEAMFVDPATHKLYIVTKEARGARLYEIAIGKLRSGERNALMLVAELDVDYVSAAAISPDGSLVVLRREDRGWLWFWRPGQSVADVLRGPPRPVPVRGRRQDKNGEAITFRPDGACYYTLSEGKKQAIYEFDVASAETATR
jgi:hypothetical protein